MKIVGYLQTSLIEWPGKISSVIFVPGCNFRCPFCHNKDLVKWTSGRIDELNEEEVLGDLKRRRKWIDGVVVTGGEPLLQKDLNGFLDRCKQMGFETMVETNGSLHSILRSMICKNLVDFVAMDYKTTFGNYPEVVNIKNEKLDIKNTYQKLKIKEADLIGNIKGSIKLLLGSSIPFELRTTVVPGIHDERVLVQMARDLNLLVADRRSPITDFRWILQNFQPKNCLDPEFEKKKPYSERQMGGFLKIVKRTIPGAKLRGV